jgi:hypothetical protein
MVAAEWTLRRDIAEMNRERIIGLVCMLTLAALAVLGAIEASRDTCEVTEVRPLLLVMTECR